MCYGSKINDGHFRLGFSEKIRVIIIIKKER